MNMKKLLTFLFALIMISTLSFGQGNLFTWTGAFDGTSWNNAGNWTIAPLPYGEAAGLSTWPGQTSTGDYAVFNSGGVFIITNVPDITLGRLEITYLTTGGGGASLVFMSGIFDGAAITMRSPSSQLIAENTFWVVKVDENCTLDLNAFFFPNRIKMVCQPGAHFWHKNSAFFFPADYSAGSTICDNQNKGFELMAIPGNHAEFIQQQATSQAVKGWIDLYLNDNQYHYICPPVTSDLVNAEFLPTNQYCRTHNSLCIFDGDYLRKYNNAAQLWDAWLGQMITCWDPRVNIETGRGYEYYGNPLNHPGGIYSFYGTFNSLNPAVAGNLLVLPVNAAGWNLVGNPFPSAITFGEPSGAPTAGAGWVWNSSNTDPIAYWWDNGLGIYRFYDWFSGIGNGAVVTERRTVPRSQAFFVFVRIFAPGSGSPLYTPSGSDVAVGNDARIFRGTQVIGKSVIANNMNITLNDASGKIIDEAILNFRDDANGTEFNGLLDAYKLFNDITNVSQLYFKTSNDEDAAMKTLKLAAGNIMYPLYMKVVNTGTYSLDVKDISTFSPNTGILLKDNKTNTTVDLKVNPVYSFTATAGDDNARFSLYFTDVLYGINNLNNTFKVYSFNNSIYIQNNDPKSITGTVLVYDMIGKQMMQENLTGDVITRINTNLNKGFYVVSIKTDNSVYNQKVYIN
jgi:hypothetical protein